MELANIARLADFNGQDVAGFIREAVETAAADCGQPPPFQTS